MDRVRDKSLKIVYQVLEKKAYSNIALNNQLKRCQFKPLERRFLTELSYGTIRRNNTLEWILSKFISKKKIQTWIKYILYTGVYQIMYMDSVPDSAACNESVELAKKYGNKGSVRFVNGVLRNVVRNKDKIEFPEIKNNPVEHISLKYYHPSWMIERWIKQFGIENTIKFCNYNNYPSKLVLRTNTLKISREKLIDKLELEGIDVVKSKYISEGLIVNSISDSLDKSNTYNNGFFIIQSESSQLVSHILSPEENKIIIDSCAAPGGKTTHLAQLVNNSAKIYAFDVHIHKINLIEEACKKLDINCVIANVEDARNLDKCFYKKADYLLLDAPCTGMGILRKPDLRWVKDKNDINKISELQKDIISSVSQCVKDRGVLVYSTCSINEEENIDVINYFINNNDCFELESIKDLLPENIMIDKEDEINAEKGFIQILPQKHNCDGFFIAKLRRKKGVGNE